MSTPEPERDPFADLLRRATNLDEVEKPRARAAFLRRVDAERERRARRPSLRWYAPAFAVALVTVLVVWAVRDDEGLGYAVNGAANEGGYIHVDAGEPAEILFTDRTLVKATPGSRLRVGETRDNGALVSIEQGNIEAEVTHTGKSDWRFVAGPFQVRVIGTRFALAWDTKSERLDVILHEGAVEIEGYEGSGPVSVRAGQRFSGDARQRRMAVSDATNEPLSAQVPGANAGSPDPASTKDLADLPVADPDAPGDATGSGKGAHAAREPRSPWAAWVSKGEFQRVVEDANARGVPQCLAQCDASELGALADAARYTGRSALAEQSLLTLRRRFASTAGNRAAFLLGRLFEGQGQNAPARTWYETSLRESPRGSFAAESLAGKMRTVNALEGRGAASPLASEYLERYPTGVHAKLARQILQTP